jgi:hypothetical protein
MTCSKVFRGVYEQRDVLEPHSWDAMKEIAETGTYGMDTPARGFVDVGIENTPLYCRIHKARVGSFLRRMINKNGMDQIFKVNSSYPIDSFILKYEGGVGSGLTPHKDGDSGSGMVSVVYTFGEGCIGGLVNISNRNDGELYGNSTNGKDVYPYCPKHNSVYAFNGNYVTHHVVNIQSGIRYAFVAFFPTRQTEDDIMRLWCPLSEGKILLCLICGNSFKTKGAFTVHSKKCSKEKCCKCGVIYRGTKAKDDLALHLEECDRK